MFGQYQLSFSRTGVIRVIFRHIVGKCCRHLHLVHMTHHFGYPHIVHGGTRTITWTTDTTRGHYLTQWLVRGSREELGLRDFFKYDQASGWCGTLRLKIHLRETWRVWSDWWATLRETWRVWSVWWGTLQHERHLRGTWRVWPGWWGTLKDEWIWDRHGEYDQANEGMHLRETWS